MNHPIENLTENMISLPAGARTLRDDRIKQIWTVDIAPFQLAKYPVTQALYFAVTNKSPSTFKGNNKPVESISWHEAIEFCNQLSQLSGFGQAYLIDPHNNEVSLNLTANGFRLPSDAEWEYACRAGEKEVRYGEINDIAWYKENSNDATQEVGLKQPNAWGLYDMLGNVWEWCWDIYDKEVYGSYRVFRGGGWSDKERGCLASNRRRSHPTYQIDDLGFRLARSQ